MTTPPPTDMTPPPPPPPPSVTVLPAGVLDASHATDSIILAGWVLDTPIDPQRVQRAWAQLVAAWPLLVARLHHDPQTHQWEYHLSDPPRLTNSFASLTLTAPMHTHYTPAQPTPFISCVPKQNPHHLYTPHGPRAVADLLDRAADRPLVHLHVSVFADGALIGLSVPHILCDGHGVVGIARALGSIMLGGPPPPPLDLADPFARYVVRDPKEASALPAPPGWRVLGIMGTLLLLARMAWEGLWASNAIENKDVYFPPEEVKRIKGEAMEDIRRELGAQTERYVSSSDAVLAYLLKLAHPPTRSRAPLTVFYTANLRHLLHGRLRWPYLRNTVAMPITPPLPVCSLSRISLGALALRIRDTVRAQLAPEASETWLRWRLAHARDLKLFFGPWRGRYNVVTNWREMRLMEVDFSGALPEGGRAADGGGGGGRAADGGGEGEGKAGKEDGKDGDGEERKVRCVYAWGDGLQPYVLQHWIGLWADDPRGGMWTSAFMPRWVWRDMRGFGRIIRETEERAKAAAAEGGR
ncbi:hypothetical protein DENSPDRAFT_842442 [Dentipellis sp. KUC8613]|nr:hypothetical protein DENSPDRAFT_842442 [Dentipellis sp. KUC8613]